MQSSGGSVGQPGALESAIPFCGNGRSAVDHFQKGNHWRGLGNTALAISDVFLVKSIVTGIGKLAVKGGSKYLYHYISKEAAESISQQGLRVGRDGYSYLTNKSGLSGIQAQIELALPANRAFPNAVLQIDVRGMSPVMIRQVTGNMPGYGAGGGTEFLFNQLIPASRIKIIP